MRFFYTAILTIGAMCTTSTAYAQIDTRRLVKAQMPPTLNMTDTVGYLKIEGIDGEVSSSNYKKWIGVLDYSIEVKSVPSSGGRSSGRAKFSDFEIVKSIDVASPDLAIYVASGRHIPKVEFEIKKGNRQYLIEMGDVVVTSVSIKNSGSGWPQERVSFSYGKIKWQYKSANGMSTDRTWSVDRNRME